MYQVAIIADGKLTAVLHFENDIKRMLFMYDHMFEQTGNKWLKGSKTIAPYHAYYDNVTYLMNPPR